MASDFVILSSGLNLSFFAIKLLSTRTSTFTQAQELGLVEERSEKILPHVAFFSNFATHLATAAISCLKTLSSKL
jgi:hypothetical protein